MGHVTDLTEALRFRMLNGRAAPVGSGPEPRDILSSLGRKAGFS